MDSSSGQRYTLLHLLHFLGSLRGTSRVKWTSQPQLETTMLKKILFTVCSTAAALTASTAALAHDGWRHERQEWRHEHRYHPYHSYYYAPRPVYVVPAPRVVYAPPPPVAYPYYAAPVVVQPGISVRFNFPL